MRRPNQNASVAADGASSSYTQDQTFDSKSQVELNRIDFQEKIDQLKVKMGEFAQKLRTTSKIVENFDDFRSESINEKSAINSVASMATVKLVKYAWIL
uniref:Uncharacterized protein n=1 Tax=Romanomermis culicivorax TaxID=13658 RepID=A0A915KEJ9_ROMCU